MGNRITEINRKLAEKRARTCVHFNGIHKDECAAGVLYDTFAGPNGELIGRLPCRDPNIPCDLRKLQTLEELLKEEEAFEARVLKTVEVFAAVKVEIGRLGLGMGNGGKGTIGCPICGGTVTFLVAASNGHTIGACSGGCASWME